MTEPANLLAISAGVVSLVGILCGLVMRQSSQQSAQQLKAVKELLLAQAPARPVDATGGHQRVSDVDLGECVVRLETLAGTTASQLTELKGDLAALSLKVDIIKETSAKVAEGFYWLQRACETCQAHPVELRMLSERKTDRKA